VLGNIVGKGIIGVWRREQCLDGEEDSADLKSRRPLVCCS
jgi:hypothetical protein